MIIKQKHIILQLLLVFIFSSFKTINNEEPVKVTLLTPVKQSSADVPLVLQFTSTINDIALYCTNSYSTTILNPEINDNTFSFTIPQHMSYKRGALTWKIIHDDKTLLTDDIYIIPANQKVIMESYAGPPSIVAGGVDYFMLTVCPADQFDNPLLDDTKVTINHQFESRIVTSDEEIKNLTTWKTIFSYEKSGRFLVNSECKGTPSKEITTEVYPNNAVDFNITATRFHDFADGNQIASFKTSIIRDQFRNIVCDGTHVIFVIKNSDGTYLTTYGNTINGIATGKMLHPEKEETWKTFAYVDGMAESDTITTKFKKLFDDFTTEFSSNNRKIRIGPIKSFMNQLIPDGFYTKLNIVRNDSIIDIKEVPTRKGYANFYLHPDYYRNDIYDFVLKAGGVTKKFNQKELKN